VLFDELFEAVELKFLATAPWFHQAIDFTEHCLGIGGLITLGDIAYVLVFYIGQKTGDNGHHH